MEQIEKYGSKNYKPAYGIGQVVRLVAFPDVKLQIISVDCGNANYVCITPHNDTYQKDNFEEHLIEPHPEYDLLPPFQNPWLKDRDYGNL